MSACAHPAHYVPSLPSDSYGMPFHVVTCAHDYRVIDAGKVLWVFPVGLGGPMPRHPSRALLLIALVGLSRLASAQEQAPLWRFTSHEQIRYRAVTQLGSLLVSTDSAVRVLDLGTGDTVWTRSDLQGLTRRAFWFIPETPYALVQARSHERTPGIWAVIDLRTGVTRWDKAAIPFARIFGSVILLDRNLLMVAGVKSAGGPIAAVALSPDSGVLRWTLDSLVDSLAAPHPSDTTACFCLAAQAPLFDSDSTVIVAPTPGGLVRLDTRSGRLLWTQDTIRNNTPSELEGYAPLATDSGLLYVPFERGIIALRIDDGTIAWRGQRKYKGVVHQMALLPEGLLLGITPQVGTTDTKSYLDLVDPRTGVSRWHSPLGGFSAATAFIVANGAVHFAAGTHWYEIDVAGDSVRREFNYYDELAGGEHPYQAEFRDSLYLLISAQGLLAVDTAGNPVFHTYHAAPGASFLKQFALVALGVAMIAASVAAARSGGPTPVFIPGRVPVVAARARAMSYADRYLYMYTGDPPDTSERKGFWLTKIDKRDGSTVGWLRFKDRHPEYTLDPATDIVLVPVEAEGTAGPGFEAKRLYLKGSNAGTETPTRRTP